MRKNSKTSDAHAQSLRENLKKRKTQIRLRKTGVMLSSESNIKIEETQNTKQS